MRQVAIYMLCLALYGVYGADYAAADCPTRNLYCGLGYTGESCAEYPIVTHWAADPGGGVERLDGTDADPRRLTPPSYQNYNGMTTDTYAPSQQEAIDFINAIERSLGCDQTPQPSTCVSLILYNYDYEGALCKLQS